MCEEKKSTSELGGDTLIDRTATSFMARDFRKLQIISVALDVILSFRSIQECFMHTWHYHSRNIDVSEPSSVMLNGSAK